MRFLSQIVGLLVFLTMVCPAHEPTFTGEVKAFYVPLRWETPNAALHEELDHRVGTLEKRLRISLDPDCRWRKPSERGCESAHAEETEKVEALAGTYEKETLGFYNIQTSAKDGSTKRDFDGLSQGYFIDTLKSDIQNPWLMDFAGDIFFSGGFVPRGKFTIADPRADLFTYAEVKMSRGWMIAATARELGATVRGKKTAPEDVTSDFVRIVLFAAPRFSGARLDAWSTALIAGGTRLLDHLWSLKEYRNQWMYLYFTPAFLREGADTEVHCAPHAEMECDFDGAAKILRLPQW